MNRKLMMGIGTIGSMAGMAIGWLAPATVILLGAGLLGADLIGVGLVFWGTTQKGAVPDVRVPAE